LNRIAVMKCVGGTGPVLLGSYLLQVLILGGIGSGLGMALGALVPVVASTLFGEILPFRLAAGIHVGPLVRAGVFGICTTLAFSSRTLVTGVRVPPAALFRGYVADSGNGGRLSLILPGVFFAVLVGLVFLFARNVELAAGFTAGTAGCFFLFRAAARGIRFLSRKMSRMENPSLRIGLAQIHRPGAPTSSLVFALGLGLTCLVAVALVNDNLTRALSTDIADKAPSFFFMDIMPGDADRFAAVVRADPGVRDLQRSPVIRGRITRLKGVDTARAEVAPEVSWAVRGDRMFTFAGSMPDGTLLAEGDWWPSDYSGEPLISLTSDLARGFGMTVGDTLTVNVLGRSITARVANIRDVDWTTLNMQFAVIFAPGPLNRAPHTWLAAVHADPGAESRVFSAVADTFPAVAIIRLRDVLDNVSTLFSRMAMVFKGVSAIALLTGFLVLAGTFSADQHRRIYDAVVYKVCGATRGDILLALITEFAVLGAATGIIACLTGGLAGWAVIDGLMHMRFTLSPDVVAATVAAGTVIALLFGLAGTARALGKKAGPYLRNE
jgi:putative ABC transport system permease protein